MKPRIFIDTNIIIDLFGHRDPYYAPAVGLFSAVENDLVDACASSLTFANIHCVLRKDLGSRMAVEALKNLRKLVAILPVGDSVIVKALDSTFSDFEDAIQYYTALENNISIIITRNIKDYRTASIPVMTAGEFLAQFTP